MNPIAPRLALTAALVVTVMSASGCASLVPADPAEGAVNQPVAHDTVEVEEQYPLDAAWLLNGRMVAFVTWGSSSCPPQIDTVASNGTSRIEVTFDQPDMNRFCTMDYTPRVSSLFTPSGIDPRSPVTLAIRLEDGQTVQTVTIDSALNSQH